MKSTLFLTLCALISASSLFAEKWAKPIESCDAARSELSQMQSTRLSAPDAQWERRMSELSTYINKNCK